MDDYLRRAKTMLVPGPGRPKVHAVLGGTELDVDSVASTLSYALFLGQEPSGSVCVPVLCGQRCGVGLPGETVQYLQRVGVSESSLLWKDDVNLLLLHNTGTLSLTLMRDQVLNSFDYDNLESSVLRVVHRHEQQAGGEGVSSTVMMVAREILQEAVEQICAPLGELLGEALRLQSEELWRKDGRRSVDLEDLLRRWQERSRISPSEVTTSPSAGETRLQDIEQALLKELKEFSDGELTMAFTTVPVDLEQYRTEFERQITTHKEGSLWWVKTTNHTGSNSDLFPRGGRVCQVPTFVVTSPLSDPRHAHQQVGVFSDNSDILNQLCCELEESGYLSAGLEPVDCLKGTHSALQLYRYQAETPKDLRPLVQQLLKEFTERRSHMSAFGPSSRTSSTEGVAGSAPLSQGSSGFTDMYGSDVERPEGPVAVATAADLGADLVSPDSGLVTVRSSRSSKESSVFLSDDSPVAEAAAGGFLLNPALGFPSLSPNAPEKMRLCRKRSSDNFELFSFDPLHSSNASMPAGGALSRSSRGTEVHGISSLSEFDELSMVDFYSPDPSAGSDLCGGKAQMGQSVNRVPPTPVNSLAGSCIHMSTEVCFFPEDVAERIKELQHKESVSSSEAWDDFGSDTKGSTSDDVRTWSLTETGYVIADCLNPDTHLEEAREEESGDVDLRNAKTQEERDVCPKPVERQLTLVNEYIEPYDTWNPDSGFTEPWQPATLSDLQLTPPDEENVEKKRLHVPAHLRPSVVRKKREALVPLTPDTSKEEEDDVERKPIELDFWTYSAQKGFLKSDSATSGTSVSTASYPESLDLWNMTIHEDSQSPLTTPDMANLSERSDSCGLPARGMSLESPVGVSSGMDMWNTTIQEDSASTATSPEIAGTGREELSGMESWEAEPETNLKELMEEDRCSEDVFPLGDKARRGPQIVIQGDEGQTWYQSGLDDHMMTDNFLTQDHITPDPDTWGTMVPITSMVTSTSEYDNVGGENIWSQISSLDLQASPGTDSIELIQGQSSPFIAVLKPDLVGGNTEYQMSDGKTDRDSGPTRTGIEPLNVERGADKRVFLFEGKSGPGHTTKTGQHQDPVVTSVESNYDNNRGDGSEASEGPDWTADVSSHSPFVLVDDGSSPAECDILPLSPSEKLAKELNFDQTSRKPDTIQTRLDNRSHLSLPAVKASDSESPPVVSSSLKWTTTVNYPDGGSHHMEDSSTMDAISLSSGSGGKEGLKPSPDSLPLWSHEDVRSNSDGDSSSGLEMDYIIVSGTVRENENPDTTRERDSGRKEGSRSLETIRHQSDVRLADLGRAELDDDSCDVQTNAVVVKSSSASLRYPAEQHFLKTREEVYVHSQISLEDSDSDGLSPSPPPPPPHQNQAWGSLPGEREDQQIQRTPPQSPLLLTDSSQSPLGDNSLTGTPENQTSGPSPVQEVGLPFSGDLMDEAEEEEVEFGVDPPCLDTGEQVERGLCGVIKSQPLGTYYGQTDEFWEHNKPQRGSHFSADGKNTTSQSERGDRFSLGPDEAEQPMRNQLQSTSQGLGDLPVNLRFGCRGDDYKDTHPPSCLGPEEVASLSWSQQASEIVPQQGSSNQDRANISHTHTDHPPDGHSEPEDNGYYQTQTQQHAGEWRVDYLSKHYEPEDHITSYYCHAKDTVHDQADNQLNYAAEGGAHWETGPQEHSRTPKETCDSTGNGHLEDQGHYETEVQYVPDGYANFLLARPTSEDPGMTTANEEYTDGLENRQDHPSLELTGPSAPPRKKLVAPEINVSLDHSEGSLLSDDALDTPDEALDTGDDLDIDVDELDTPDEADSLEFNGLGDPQGSKQETDREPSEAIPEYSAEEERQDTKLWRTVVIGEQEHRIDMKCIEPYQRVISHGGYNGDLNAIVVFAACFLPDSDCDGYNYVMDNLFLYVISTLELMVAEDYLIVYLNGATPRRRMPGLGWMKKCYHMIDRRLRKNLKSFIIVHPSWFIRTVLGVIRPFISSKFSSKIKYVNSLTELRQLIPMEYVHIPESIIKVDKRLNSGV
ncbi:hypothetical protein DPEC_G00123540 [Dallia pectoralis]|uniref:Uncharacterized protein n=1 Tax=Dallia pectoralis TaxID=75939 RepID=A0ACC2GQV7_DALPE|nr:hypothetical protein DPEC_G00123540 [Dallia pectoralis]